MRRDLPSRLFRWVSHYRNLGRANHAAAVAMFLAALGASGLATFLASHITTSMSSWLPVLTAAPGIIVLAHGFFNFERKALWHFEKSRKLEAIFRKLDVGGITGDEAADRWNSVDDEMDKKWPGFGKFSIAPGHSG